MDKKKLVVKGDWKNKGPVIKFRTGGLLSTMGGLGLLQNLINKENFISTGGWMEPIIFVLNKDDVETFLELVPEASNKKVELGQYWIEVF